MTDFLRGRGQSLRRLLSLAVPLILSQLINQTQMFIDRIFLGQADNLYMSALGNINSPLWTTMSFCFAIGTGASILISQSIGASDRAKAEEYAGALIKYNNVVPALLCFFWAFCSGAVFRLMGVSDEILPLCEAYVRYYSPTFLLVGFGSSLVTILQTSKYTRPLAMYGLVRSVLNIALDWLLIFGKCGFPEMGIRGAALGTTIAEYLGMVYLVAVFIKKRDLETRPSLRSVAAAKFRTFLKSARLGLNTALEDFAWNLGNLMLIRILNSINELAAGIYAIVFGIEVIAVVVVGAVGNGTLTLTSEATGRCDARQYRGVTACAYALCALDALATVALSLAIPEQIISLFTKDATVIASSGLFLLMISVNLFSKSANIIIGNAIRGSGDTRWMFFTQIFGTVFVVSTAALFTFALGLGIAGVFLAVLVDEAVRGVINFTRFRSIARRIGKGRAPKAA